MGRGRVDGEGPMGAAGRRHYLMCPPTFYTVAYEINPWMHADQATDTALAVRQWQRLREVYRDLGHTVETIDPLPGLPDMVYAANGALVVDGVVYSAKFRHPQRQPEGPAYQAWFDDRGYRTHTAQHVNEGEGDILVAGRTVLAGTGFRTTRAAHDELRALLTATSGADAPEVVGLELVDPRYYHLDTALTVLRDDEIAYHPDAFSPATQALLADRYPDAVEVGADDAAVLGLNAVSDGQHVVMTPAATRFADQLRERGYTPVPVATSELLKGGGGAKCCTLEIRPAP
ncbi:MAG: arginine deiminase family protein [Micrococcales bacterium]|nr:arginine deiminase family protein [Micrococcales bacterium]